MANIVLTTVCNQRCPYCFAIEHRAEAKEHDQRYLSTKAFDERIAFCQRSGMDTIRLIGGEPTLHPAFVPLCQRALDAGLNLMLFTNGLMPPPVQEFVESLAPERVSALVNVNHPQDTGPKRHQQRIANLRRLGERAAIGYNIYRVDRDPTFLVDLPAETGCKPDLRLGLAHPCLEGTNRHLLPSQYVAAGRLVVELARRAHARGVNASFDCGFVRCMFSDEDMEMLAACGVEPVFGCSPCLDIGLDGQVFHCFALSGRASIPLTDDLDRVTAQQRLAEVGIQYRASGVFPECAICPFRERGECSGGCLATTMRRYRPAAFEIDMTEEVAP